jgi:hypothetical protein
MNAPEKIYGWMDSQLSIARFYGGIYIYGHYYLIDMIDPEHPLIRQDLIKKKKLKKVQKSEKDNSNIQQELI